MRTIFKAIAGFAVPPWLPYVAAVFIAFGTYWYVDHRARVNERALVEGEYAIRDRDAKIKSDEEYAKRAKAAADEIAELTARFEAEIEDREKLTQEMSAAWKLEVARQADLATRVCWPASIARELRK